MWWRGLHSARGDACELNLARPEGDSHMQKMRVGVCVCVGVCLCLCMCILCRGKTCKP